MKHTVYSFCSSCVLYTVCDLCVRAQSTDIYLREKSRRSRETPTPHPRTGQVQGCLAQSTSSRILASIGICIVKMTYDVAVTKKKINSVPQQSEPGFLNIFWLSSDLAATFLGHLEQIFVLFFYKSSLLRP